MNIDIDALRKHLKEHEDTFYGLADRIVTLSAGSLAMSVTFRESIVGSNVSEIWLLQSSWAGFSLCILAGTFYHFSKAKVHWGIAQQLAAGEKPAVASAGKFYNWVFRTSLLGFCSGICCLALFGILNAA